MSADGNVKFTSFAHHPGLSRSSTPHARTRQRVCAFCELPLKANPVLLKSGHTVHVDCYYRMQKYRSKDRPN